MQAGIAFTLLSQSNMTFCQRRGFSNEVVSPLNVTRANEVRSPLNVAPPNEVFLPRNLVF